MNEPTNEPPLPIPQICATCEAYDSEPGFCMMWCKQTDALATCGHWTADDEI